MAPRPRQDPSSAGRPACALGVGDEQVEEIVFGPKAEGRLGDDDIQLVRTLAGQLSWRSGTPDSRVASSTPPSRSGAGSNNIHDSAQQELVPGRKAGDGPIGSCSGEPESGRDRRLRLDAQRIMSDLRELSQGIHPSVLSDGGSGGGRGPMFAAALEVTLETSDGLRARRFGDNIEVPPISS